MTNSKLPSLNGLRAISIILVIINHLSIQYNFGYYFGNSKYLNPILSFLQDGQLGVNTFFEISGFLITYLLLKEEEKYQTISLKKFYVRRFLRIFPGYYFLLFVYLILQLSGYLHIVTSAWITALTYTKYLNWQIEVFTAHAWSLSIEEQFYLLWPFIFLLGKNVRKIVAIALVCIVPLLRLYFYYHDPSNEEFYKLSVFTRIDSIAIGCLCALYLPKILSMRKKVFRPLLIVSVISLLFISFLPHLHFNVDWSKAWIAFGLNYTSGINLFIAPIIIYSVFGPKTLWYKMLNSKLFNFIGILSYSIYLWQQFFLYDHQYLLGWFPANLICVFGAALFSYFVIERPFLKLKTRFQSDRDLRMKVLEAKTRELSDG